MAGHNSDESDDTDDSEKTITQKMADQERSDFCVVFTMSLCRLESKQTLIRLLFQPIRL